ncbi:MAG: folK [Gammaproteobacteria bacterium]|jgi:2-amino-4-hydroxy-6-hydroxymethyldihydropteridine diphosphokinase|nr:folK [Gammaproteobacteria bacterium]
MSSVFLALGSNLNDPQKQILSAIAALEEDPHITVYAVSSLYQTPAMGPPQNDYINASMHISTEYSARELLSVCLALEKTQGRVRIEPWGPRCIDIDILLYDNIQNQEKDFILPHPGLKERLFVLVPLYEIAPQLILPDGVALATLLQNFGDDEIALIRRID